MTLSHPTEGDALVERLHWRIGRRVARNVYQGDVPMFMAATPEQASEMVALLNAGQALSADAVRSEKHRNDLMDAVVRLRTEAGAAKDRASAAEARAERLEEALRRAADNLQECHSAVARIADGHAAAFIRTMEDEARAALQLKGDGGER